MIHETFAKRLAKLAKSDTAEIFVYDSLPSGLRVQINHILRDSLGDYGRANVYAPACAQVAREMGRYFLIDGRIDKEQECFRFIETADFQDALSLIEICFTLLNVNVRNLSYYERDSYRIVQEPNEAIEELNYRFKEHLVGYQFHDNQIFRVDSAYLHAEVTKKALMLLQDQAFAGAQEEFLVAHECHIHKREKEAIVAALRSLESVLKTICRLKGWEVSGVANANVLINTVFQNELIPKSLQSHFSALVTTLTSGVPTIRNKNGGHGQGSVPVEIPNYLSSYQLHLCASAIVFLVEAFRAG